MTNEDPEDRVSRIERNLETLAKTVRERLDDDERGLDYLRREMEATQEAFYAILRGEDPAAIPEAVRDIDIIWRCPCGQKLGMYSRSEDLMRIKVREQYLCFRVGSGGYIESSCPKCGRMVREEGT